MPKEVATAICHSGIPAGIVKGIKEHVTKNPSLTGCFLTTAKSNSQKAPDAKVTIIEWMDFQ